MATIQRIKTGDTNWGSEATKLNSNFESLNTNKVEKVEGSRLITEEESQKLGELEPQKQSDLAEVDNTLPTFVKGQDSFREKISKEVDAKIAVDGNRFITPTLNKIPTSSTLTYTIGELTYDFKVGQFARALVNGEPKLYQLYNISNGTATWKEANSGSGGGGGSTGGGYAEGVSWYDLQNPTTIIPLNGISFSVASVSYLVKDGEITGDSKDISSLLVFDPVDASDTEVNYTTNDQDLLVVNGEVTKVPTVPGSYTITATSIDGGFTATITVNVANYIPVESISWKTNDITIYKYENPFQLATSLEITPNNATEKAVTYSSDNPSIATVDSSGKVTAVDNGNCNIKATLVEDPTKFATLSLHVQTHLTTLNIVQTELKFTQLEQQQKLNLQLLPLDATIGLAINWSSNHPEIATVSTDGIVTSKAFGNAVITATNGSLSDTANISIGIPVTGVTLDKVSATLALLGILQLVHTIYPSDATNQSVTWESSDETIATVSDTGLVTAKEVAGDVEIKVKTIDGNFEATCAITVRNSGGDLK